MGVGGVSLHDPGLALRSDDPALMTGADDVEASLALLALLIGRTNILACPLLPLPLAGKQSSI